LTCVLSSSTKNAAVADVPGVRDLGAPGVRKITDGRDGAGAEPAARDAARFHAAAESVGPAAGTLVVPLGDTVGVPLVEPDAEPEP
jgi:hypothetical protein